MLNLKKYKKLKIYCILYIMFILRLCMFYFVFVDDFYEIFKIIYVSDSEEEKDEYFLVS